MNYYPNRRPFVFARPPMRKYAEDSFAQRALDHPATYLGGGALFGAQLGFQTGQAYAYPIQTAKAAIRQNRLAERMGRIFEGNRNAPPMVVNRLFEGMALTGALDDVRVRGRKDLGKYFDAVNARLSGDRRGPLSSTVENAMRSDISRGVNRARFGGLGIGALGGVVAGAGLLHLRNRRNQQNQRNQSGFERVKDTWESLSPKQRTALIGGLALSGTASAVGSGLGYHYARQKSIANAQRSGEYPTDEIY